MQSTPSFIIHSIPLTSCRFPFSRYFLRSQGLASEVCHSVSYPLFLLVNKCDLCAFRLGLIFHTKTTLTPPKKRISELSSKTTFFFPSLFVSSVCMSFIDNWCRKLLCQMTYWAGDKQIETSRRRQNNNNNNKHFTIMNYFFLLRLWWNYVLLCRFNVFFPSFSTYLLSPIWHISSFMMKMIFIGIWIGLFDFLTSSTILDEGYDWHYTNSINLHCIK